MFKEFGIVDTEEYIEDKNTLNLTFRTRKEAEIVRINTFLLLFSANNCFARIHARKQDWTLLFFSDVNECVCSLFCAKGT